MGSIISLSASTLPANTAWAAIFFAIDPGGSTIQNEGWFGCFILGTTMLTHVSDFPYRIVPDNRVWTIDGVVSFSSVEGVLRIIMESRTRSGHQLHVLLFD